MRDDAVKLFDSHCHLDMEEFRGRIDEILERARIAGVKRILLAACDETSSYEVLRIATRGNAAGIEVWAAAGVHPHEAESTASGLPEELTDLTENIRVVAVGEMGLDFYYDHSPRNIQMQVFEWQIEWAKRAKKPIIVHLRNEANREEGDAYKEAISIMKKTDAQECSGVIHCFSGNQADAKAALDMGFYISFAGPLTYPKAQELRDVAAYVPLNRIFCETDSPYLAPQSHRGKRNEPALVRDVYEKMAQIKNMSLEKLAEAIWRNGEELFGQKNSR